MYELFHNDATGQETVVEYKDGAYRIDSNGDGAGGIYVFYSGLGLSTFERKKGTPWFELLVLWKRRRQ